ncbi:MAG: hypothetical protein FP831_13155 [Anaerolineae bacterium]|nr:hypothetical protein [Anaerolineae bacterium]
MNKKHWGRPAIFSTEIKKSDLQAYIEKRKASNPEFAENYDEGYAEFIRQMEIPNEVSRQAIQDAVNGVGMQTVNSMEEFMKAMEE